jgi:hypothetical protein
VTADPVSRKGGGGSSGATKNALFCGNDARTTPKKGAPKNTDAPRKVGKRPGQPTLTQSRLRNAINPK